MIQRLLQRYQRGLLTPVSEHLDSVRRALLFGQGVQSAHAWRNLDHVRHLSDAEFQVYSQWGEDGILEWLLQRLPISSRRFIEFGVEDYTEANTRFLLLHRNWKGLILDGSPEHMRRVRREDFYWRHDLTAVSAFINRDNINALLADHGFSGPVGVLSVDIDGNDYWVWEAIEVADADIVICEYNAILGDLYPISIPYVPNFRRTAAHYSNLYYGASIAALRLLAQRKGYELLGTNRAGSNAFFVRRNLLPSVDGAISDKSPLPSFVRESRDKDGNLNFICGVDRLSPIEDLPVVRVDTGETVALKTLGPIYSQQWLNEMCAG